MSSLMAASLPSPIISPSISLRSDAGNGFSSKFSRSPLLSFGKNNCHNTATKLKVTTAMGRVGGGGGVAKFKGTQMREKQLTEMIEKKVMEAQEVCGGGAGGGDDTSDECKVAWDEVEEVSQAKADLRLKLENQQDPLLHYCQDHHETDECRFYDD